ncbi:hypothetical protein HK103_007113 [Boothiomyces macroporosus]|uniref:UspA domain-containing protein n=1 Tax=Boothiomyces macroporosus TaxID=261099 RepID=A0AAD5UCZ1_9FUNG|nr:hypothetical protein HK103_007113 [Boothiomyces macroporosus]
MTGEIKRKVLIAVDGSESSQRALEWAKTNMVSPTDRIIIVTVRASHQVPSIRRHDLEEHWKAIEADSLLAAQNLLAVSKAQFPDNEVDTYTLVGDARIELEAKIAQVTPALVIVGSRGMGSIKKLIVGSVSKYLLDHVQAPVLVVR